MTKSTAAIPSRKPIPRLLKRMHARFEAGDACGTGVISKVSREGLFVATETLPAPGTSAQITFRTHDGDEIQVSGSVRWNTAQLDPGRSGFGVHIESPSREYHQFYEAMLTR